MKAIFKNNFSLLKFSHMNFCFNSMKIENKNYHQNGNFNYYFHHKLIFSSESNLNSNSIKNSNCNIQTEIKNIKIKKEKEINNSMIIEIVNPIESIFLNDHFDNDINNNKNNDNIIKINEIQFKARNNRIPKQVRLFYSG